MAPCYGQDEVWILQPGEQCACSLASAYLASLIFCSPLQLIQEPSASEYAMFFLTHGTLYIISLVSFLCWVLSPNHASDIWSDIISTENTPQVLLGFPSVCHHIVHSQHSTCLWKSVSIPGLERIKILVGRDLQIIHCCIPISWSDVWHSVF